MKTRAYWIGLMLTAVLFVLAACNSEDPTPTNTPEPVAVDPTSTPEPDPTEAPPTEPATDPTAEPVEEPEEPEAPAETDQPDNLAPIVNDEGGPVSITGVVSYTNPFFTLGIAAPVIILEDQSGFVDRDEDYVFPIESQTLGQITSDFFTSPFSYSIALPIQPLGGFRDVDNDGEEDPGVQVSAIAYWNNIFGDPFLEIRDQGGGAGWSGAYASTKLSEEVELEREIVGGQLIVFAPDDQQGFPAGFGEDRMLFTEDDPIVILPQGYTLVNLDTDPFTFDRSRNPRIDLYEPDGAALVDYSEESYTDAFNNLVDQLINEYAFTEYKNIDWEALRAQYAPLMADADANEDADLYLRTLRDFAWSIPDGHISGPFLGDEFRQNVLGGIGMAIRELDNGRILTVFILENGPAAEAGIEERAEIISINGVPITEHVTNTTNFFGPYSTTHTERLDKLWLSTRFPIGTEVEVTFQNPGGTEQTVTLEASSELDSYFYWLEDDDRDGFELPVEYELLEEGIGYVQIFSFSDDDQLTITLWERMIESMKENEVTELIIDMRTNGGGRGFLANTMAAHFFDEELVLGSSSFYDDERGEFYADPDSETTFLLPDEELIYNGRIAILVSPDCASACEFFSYYMTLQDRATIIGHYPTAGLGGSIDRVAMPEDEEFTFTQGRAVDPDGNIHIEGIGVVPDIRVPVTEQAIFDQEDAVLQVAINFFLGETLDGGLLLLGDEITAELLPGQRASYQLVLREDDIFSMLVDSNTDGQEVILTVLDENGNLLAETDPDTEVGFLDIELGEEITLTLEVSTVDNAGAVNYTIRIVDEG